MRLPDSAADNHRVAPRERCCGTIGLSHEGGMCDGLRAFDNDDQECGADEGGDSIKRSTCVRLLVHDREQLQKGRVFYQRVSSVRKKMSATAVQRATILA